MSTTKPTGGPAFPVPSNYNGSDRGMMLRDYFAAKAMQGLMATETAMGWSSNDIAKCAYAQADAMLAAHQE